MGSWLYGDVFSQEKNGRAPQAQNQPQKLSHMAWGNYLLFPTWWWFQIFNIFYFHPYLKKWSNLTSIFVQMGWNHQQPPSLKGHHKEVVKSSLLTITSMEVFGSSHNFRWTSKERASNMTSRSDCDNIYWIAAKVMARLFVMFWDEQQALFIGCRFFCLHLAESCHRKFMLEKHLEAKNPDVEQTGLAAEPCLPS